MIKQGDVLQLDVIGTNIYANGVAKVDDMVVFCVGAVEGDVVRAEITEVKKNYCVAKCLDIVSPSDNRCAPTCQNFRFCGGCSFDGVTAAHEAKVKRESVRAAFRREGLTAPAVEFEDGANAGYRNKAVFHFDKEKNVGFFAAGTHEFVPVDSCPVCRDGINEIRRAAESILKDETTLSGEELTYLYIRYMKETNEASVVLGYTGNAALDGFAESLTDVCPTVKCVARGRRSNPEARDERIEYISGGDCITASVAGLEFALSPESFFQVNEDGAEVLAAKVVEYAALKNGERAADIYCGTGFFGLVLAKSAPGAEVYGIEKNTFAVSNANLNAVKNGVSNAFFLAGDSSELMAKTGVDSLDVALVDPPRTGLTEKTVSQLETLAPRRIVYVSCNPSTLARDVRMLSDNYTLERITAVNMFPHTNHVESVVRLIRN